MEGLRDAVAHGEFHHEAFFYSGPDEFLRGTASFVREVSPPASRCSSSSAPRRSRPSARS